jgi:hypothetical protein
MTYTEPQYCVVCGNPTSFCECNAALVIDPEDIKGFDRARATVHEWHPKCATCGHKEAITIKEGKRKGRVVGLWCLVWCASTTDSEYCSHYTESSP